MKILFRQLLALACVFYGASACAADPEPAKPQLPQTIEALGQKWNLTVLKQFKTDVPDMTGYVVKGQGGKTGILYSIKNVVISGPIFDANGTNLAEKYAQDNLPKPDYAAAVKTLEKDKTLVNEGKSGAPVLYAIADPNCIYCHKFWQETRDWVNQGKVQIRWVVVGFLKPTSAGRAAAMIASKDSAKAIAEDQAKFDEANEEGAIAELKPIPQELQDALHQHEALMNSLEFQGTPALIFKDKDGHWQGVAGMPPMDQLAAALGLAKS